MDQQIMRLVITLNQVEVFVNHNKYTQNLNPSQFSSLSKISLYTFLSLTLNCSILPIIQIPNNHNTIFNQLINTLSLTIIKIHSSILLKITPMNTVNTPSVDFRLFQLEDRLQRLTNRVELTLQEDLLQNSEAILLPKLNLTIDKKIEQFYTASELGKQNALIQSIVSSKVKQIEPVLKNNILKENRLIIDAELRDIRTALLKKKEGTIQSKQKQSKQITTPLEFKQKIELVMMELEEMGKAHKRNYELTENIEKLSYDRIDDMRQTMQIAIQQISNTRVEVNKIVSELQVSVNKVILNPANKESRLGVYQDISEQIVKCLTKTEFEHIHLKKFNSEILYLKDEIAAIKNIKNNESQYQKYITRVVERIERFNSYLTEHQNRRQEVEKMNFKTRIEKLESTLPTFNHKFNILDKAADESSSRMQILNSNLIQASASHHMEVKGLRQKIQRLDKETALIAILRDDHFIPFKNEVNISFRRMSEEIQSYQLMRGQISLIKQELGEIEKALSIMDAKFSMLKQEIPKFRKPQEQLNEIQKPPNQPSMKYRKSVDETQRQNIRVKQNPMSGTRYSVKLLRSLVQQH